MRGRRSSAFQPSILKSSEMQGVGQRGSSAKNREASLPQSDAEARVYIWKLMLEPPPRMFAQGTMDRRPRRCDDF